MKKTILLIAVVSSITHFSCSKDTYGSNDNKTSTSFNDSSNIKLMWENNSSYETTINVGQTITWVWGSGRHNLRSISGVETLDSGYSSNRGFEFSHTFNNVGTTNYICDPHKSHMYGKVIVEEKESNSNGY